MLRLDAILRCYRNETHREYLRPLSALSRLPLLLSFLLPKQSLSLSLSFSLALSLSVFSSTRFSGMNFPPDDIA